MANDEIKNKRDHFVPQFLLKNFAIKNTTNNNKKILIQIHLQKNKVCVYCGSTNNLTVEHALPKQLFSKDYKKQLDGRGKKLITVFACKPCNSSFSTYEERFREFLLNCSGTSSSITTDLLKIQKRAYEHAPGKAFNLINKMSSIMMQTADGTHEMALYNLSLGDQTMIQKIIKKIIQCLLFHHTTKILTNEHEFICNLQNPLNYKTPEEFFNTKFYWVNDFKEVCKYGFSLIPNTTNGIWILTFFNQVTFWSILRRKSYK